MSIEVTTRAYGRVNLIGEHTDYNGGWVLPTAIPQYTEVRMERIFGNQATVISSDDPEKHAHREYSWEIGKEKVTHTWADYLQGATRMLLERDDKIFGFTAHIESTIPEGSGVSSSAALEMSFLQALKKMFQLDMNETELALIGQRIENDFVGAKVGIMDQMAVSLAKDGEALFLDTKTLHYDRIRLPENMDLLVINSGVAHKLSAGDGGYNQRRAECEEACKLLSIQQLRDITLEELERSKLPQHLKKRAHHVVSENARVHEAVKAIRENDLVYLGKLFNESHRSMRDDYEVSVAEIDLLVDLTVKEQGTFGARLTGGGFGGSIVAITAKGKGDAIAEKVMKEYEHQTRIRPLRLV